MRTEKEIVERPTGFDSLSNFVGQIPCDEWMTLLTRNRDSDCLTQSNWDCALAELGGESETVQIRRYGHWACGWYETLNILSGSKQEVIANDIERGLENYPVLNDEHFSELESEAANQVWANCYDFRERIEYVREHRSQFEFRGHNELRACIRGEYFCGYASELIK